MNRDRLIWLFKAMLALNHGFGMWSLRGPGKIPRLMMYRLRPME
jgi:hypothetical protein